MNEVLLDALRTRITRVFPAQIRGAMAPLADEQIWWRPNEKSNSIGNLVAMLNPLIVAYSVQWFGNWDLPLYVMGGLFLVGAACWTIIDPRRPVFGADPETLETGAATFAPTNAR